MIDRSTIERIKERADIVDVVSEFVSLKKVGVNYRGLCPFHNDHTPSFYVSPTRRTCHCFVCGEGGDSVGFIMKHEQMTYPEALRWLANRYNIEIQERELTEEQRKEQTERESMFIVNQWAAEYFNNILRNDIDGRAIGMQYFRQRGIREDIIEKFQLGFCLDAKNAMAKEAEKKGYSAEYLIKTGLCYAKDNGDLMDRFAGRVIFPWKGVSGKVTAFGGRVLDSRTKGVSQKYVNSPDSEIYHKDHELYGIFQAKKAIAKENCVYMVEGYTDVISMHQCGIENVVANSGTALSEYQIHILHRFTPNIVLLYDGDEAGIKAALRGTDMLLKEGMNVKVLLLPDGEDPDSFARKHSAEEYRTYIKENQTDIITFKIKVLLDGVTDPMQRSEAITSIIQSVSVISDPIVRATYIQECSARLHLSERTLVSKLNEIIRRQRSGTQQNTTNADRQQAQQEQHEKIENNRQRAQEGSGNNGKGQKSRTSTIATMLAQLIVKHGNEIIFRNVETEDGNTIDLTVAQYIDYDLASDNLSLGSPQYEQIRQEAVEHSEDPDFNSLQYFTLHPDIEISQLSIKLSTERVILSKSMKMKYNEDSLRENTSHLLLDFRKEYVRKDIDRLRRELAQQGNAPEYVTSLLKELSEKQALYAAISKKLGSSIVVR